MLFNPMRLSGSYLIECEPFKDDRGELIKSFSKEAFSRIGLEADFVECNISRNLTKGTLRGMHFQASPYEEVKLISCTRGSLYDVIVDLRPDSSTYKEWIAIELRAEDRKLIYVPKGFAHGFQTLEDDTELFYQVSAPYRPAYGRGVRWNDPAFKIIWPLEVTRISQKDRECRDFV